MLGLGNQGDKYQKNRHNLGFIIIDNYTFPEKFEFNAKTNSFLIKKSWTKLKNIY